MKYIRGMGTGMMGVALKRRTEGVITVGDCFYFVSELEWREGIK